MKKLIATLTLMVITTICSAQKPMVGFTEDEIKAVNRIEFSTLNWETTYEKDIWLLLTKNERFNLVSVYTFTYGNPSNVMFTHATQKGEVALVFLDKIKETYIQIANNKFYHIESKMTVECSYDKEKNIFTFHYYISTNN